DAARAAGADLRDRTRLTALVWEGERVVGVRATAAGGDEQEFRASLVVGADGRHSTVARLVQAEEYLGYDSPRAMYWGYWPAPRIWRDRSAYPFDMYIGKTGRDARVIFQTDGDQLLIGSLPPVAAAPAWRSDPEGALKANLAGDPATARLVAEGQPDGGVKGTVKERYFFRRGAGPGWALLGDAGHHKEFIIGDGITEALIQARSLSAAIARGTDEARVAWWRARDVEALPLFFFGQDEGAVRAPLKLEEVVFSRVARMPELLSRMAEVMEHRVSPYEAFPAALILRWTLGATLRGSPRVLADFLAIGLRGAAVGRELRRRRRLLEGASSGTPPGAAGVPAGAGTR
ncbi:MAG TPA: FAD-dependent monooxygenase, partial [Vicinamibacterales bacterium]|nr:FAD-dependent monooxygenase [Vicinamibacterales bacterium]